MLAPEIRMWGFRVDVVRLVDIFGGEGGGEGGEEVVYIISG